MKIRIAAVAASLLALAVAVSVTAAAPDGTSVRTRSKDPARFKHHARGALAGPNRFGSSVSLTEARERAGYAINTPTYTPAGLELRDVRIRGKGPRIRVLLVYGRQLRIALIPRPGMPHYSRRVAQRPDGSLLDVKGAPGASFKAKRGTHVVRWYEDGIETVIFGKYSVAELLRVANSIQRR